MKQDGLNGMESDLSQYQLGIDKKGGFGNRCHVWKWKFFVLLFLDVELSLLECPKSQSDWPPSSSFRSCYFLLRAITDETLIRNCRYVDMHGLQSLLLLAEFIIKGMRILAYLMNHSRTMSITFWYYVTMSAISSVCCWEVMSVCRKGIGLIAPFIRSRPPQHCIMGILLYKLARSHYLAIGLWVCEVS